MSQHQNTEYREIRHFHLFCGLGGGAKGFNAGQARVGSMEARMRCIGGVDVDPAVIRDFEKLSGVKGTLLDMFDRQQYREFHGVEPPAGWREATPGDIQKAAGNEHPHIVFLSSPCKAFSGLLSESKSVTPKYQALNRLTVRGIWLMLEAFSDDPPELVIFENVPRIANRGRALLDQIQRLLAAFGYAVAETTHDCGAIGGLAQSRKRFLLVARHVAKVPPFLYEPSKQRLRGVGEILDRLPLPGDLRAGPMHRIPSLHWKTWVRLAFVEAGSDWRSLKKLRVEDGFLKDYLILPGFAHNGWLGVQNWHEPAVTVTSRGRPNNGAFAIADPRLVNQCHDDILGIRQWAEPTNTVTGKSTPTNGAYSVADPRVGESTFGQAGVLDWKEPANVITGQRSPLQGKFSVADPRPQNNRQFAHIYRVVAWDQSASTVIGKVQTSDGAQSVADPRPCWDGRYGNLAVTQWKKNSRTVTAGGKGVQGGYLSVADPRMPDTNPNRQNGIYRVDQWTEPSHSITGAVHSAGGALAVADPRPGFDRIAGDDYLTAGHYGVVPWESPSGAVSAAAGHDNGRWSVADPRLPEPSDRVVAVIRALDGTWHRPFTTLELAALQSLVDPDECFELFGTSDSAHRERIGNAVPPAAAAAIASMMAETLLLAWSGETFQLSATPIWVRPVAVALSVKPTNWSQAKEVR